MKYPELRYINLDLFENREALREISALNWHRDIGEAVIDEAQKEASIFEKIKYAYDEGKISFQVLLGSSQITIKKIRETLESFRFNTFGFI
ncbi:AAA family ATPase [Thermodesulfovibrio sp. TK110]